MHYSNKYQLFCTREHSAYGKRGNMIYGLLLKPVNNDGYDEIRNVIEIYMRIMDSVHYKFEQKKIVCSLRNRL